MVRGRTAHIGTFGLSMSVLAILLMAPGAIAKGSAQIRWIDAVPGADDAQLSVRRQSSPSAARLAGSRSLRPIAPGGTATARAPESPAGRC